MHSGRVIIYPCVITLKSRCWNICAQADRRERPLKDCLKHTLPRKWRYGTERRIRDRREIKRWDMRWGGRGVNTRSSSFKRDGLMSSQIQWLISRLMEKVKEKFRERARVCCQKPITRNSMDMHQTLCDLTHFTDLNNRILSVIIKTFGQGGAGTLVYQMHLFLNVFNCVLWHTY